MSIFGQKTCILGPTIFKIPQPNWPVGTCWTCVWPSASPINSIKSVMVAWKVTKKNGEPKEYKSRRNFLILCFNFTFYLCASAGQIEWILSHPVQSQLFRLSLIALFISLRGHSTTTWTQFCHFFTSALPCLDNFYTLSMDKNRHFFTPSPPHLFHIVIEWPLTKKK